MRILLFHAGVTPQGPTQRRKRISHQIIAGYKHKLNGTKNPKTIPGTTEANEKQRAPPHTAAVKSDNHCNLNTTPTPRRVCTKLRAQGLRGQDTLAAVYRTTHEKTLSLKLFHSRFLAKYGESPFATKLAKIFRVTHRSIHTLYSLSSKHALKIVRRCGP